MISATEANAKSKNNIDSKMIVNLCLTIVTSAIERACEIGAFECTQDLNRSTYPINIVSDVVTELRNNGYSVSCEHLTGVASRDAVSKLTIKWGDN